MITVNITYPWHVLTPTVLRYLPRQYVDAFFSSGRLRLSSFASFHQHEDEQRLDKEEGKTFFVHRTQAAGGQTLTAHAEHGHNAYVLSTTMRHDEVLMKAFNCDSYIRINDTTQFGARIAKHVPGLVAGCEGPCLYQTNKTIERDLGYIDLKRFGEPVDEGRLHRFINDQMKHLPFLLKSAQYSQQVEYRLLWFAPGDVGRFLDITAPELIPLCSPPSDLTA